MGEYEFVPSKELKKLEQEITELKSHPVIQDEQGKRMQESMTALHQSMERMLDVFKKATDDMELEEREDKLMQKHLGPLSSEVSSITEQNETLAEGVVNISDAIDEMRTEIQKLHRGQKEIKAQLSELQGQQTQAPMPQQGAPTSFNDPYSSPQYAQPMQYSEPQGPNDFSSMPPPPPPSQNAIPSVPKDGLAKKKGLFGK